MHPIEWLRAVARSGDVPQTQLATEAAGALAAMADEPHGLLPACRRLIDRNPSAGALWWTCARLLTAADTHAEASAVQRDLDSDQVGLSLALDLPDGATVAAIGWSDVVGETAARRGDVRLLVVAEETPPRRPGRRGPGGGAFGGGGGGGRSVWDVDFDSFDAPDDDDDAVVIVPPQGLGTAVAHSDLLLVDCWAIGGSQLVAAPGSLAAAATAARTGTPVWLTVSVGRRLPEPLFKALSDKVFGGDGEPWDAGADLLDRDLVGTVVEPIEIPCPLPPELLHRSR